MVMGGSYLLLAMMVLLVDERTLETGLDKAYISFNNSAASFLEKNTGLDSSGPASKLVLKFFIALWIGLIGQFKKMNTYVLSILFQHFIMTEVRNDALHSSMCF